MPRDGANIYSRPVGTDGVPNATILSAAYNVYVADVEQDLNAPRPVVAGGTGATSPITARAQLGAEVSSLSQIVTNYDEQVWESGSFLSFAHATAAPTDPDKFAGVCVLMTGDQANIYLHATNFTTGEIYVRRKNSGAWTPWILGADQSKLGVAGGTITGDLVVNGGTVLQGHVAIGTTLDVFGPAQVTSGILTANGGIISNAGLQVNADAVITGQLTATGNLVADGNIEINGATAVVGGILTAGGGIISNAGVQINAAANVTGQLTASGNFVADGNITLNGATAVVGGVLTAGSGIVSNAGVLFNAPLQVAHNVSAYGITTQGSADPSYAHRFNNAGAAMVGNIFVGAAATAFNTTCDARLKDNVQLLDGAGNLIDRTRIYGFRWKGTDQHGTGVLAQEAAEVFPDAFTHDTISDWWGVDYSKYVPLLIAELQALRKRVAELEAVRR